MCLVAEARFPAVFLPGILLPASARYARLVEMLDGRDAWPKDLEVYAGDRPAHDYGIDSEVAGLERFVDARGADRFHLYGHSAGGSIALAFAATHGDRLLSLALDEPATDFSAEDRELIAALWGGSLEDLSVPERMKTFARAQVRPGVELPPPPSGPPSPAMAGRPAGLAAIERAIADYRIDDSALRAFPGPVYFSHGSLSNARWELMADRLAVVFRDIEVERYDGLHHLNTSHAAEPARVAAALRRLWVRAEKNTAERVPVPVPSP
jgi:pimeloyl-ACP methyl ester carboxylesterase